MKVMIIFAALYTAYFISSFQVDQYTVVSLGVLSIATPIFYYNMYKMA